MAHQQGSGTPAGRPNVLFILSDQHNAKVLGHQGHPDVRTPHLDRLAAQGTRFEACTTANPICTPSRVSFLSGQYCHNHGYYGLSGPAPRGLPTLQPAVSWKRSLSASIQPSGQWILPMAPVR